MNDIKCSTTKHTFLESSKTYKSQVKSGGPFIIRSQFRLEDFYSKSVGSRYKVQSIHPSHLITYQTLSPIPPLHHPRDLSNSFGNQQPFYPPCAYSPQKLESTPCKNHRPRISFPIARSYHRISDISLLHPLLNANDCRWDAKCLSCSSLPIVFTNPTFHEISK